MENEEKRMLADYEVKQSIHIGKKEVVFGVNEADKYPFMVCYCTYDKGKRFSRRQVPYLSSVLEARGWQEEY